MLALARAGFLPVVEFVGEGSRVAGDCIPTNRQQRRSTATAPAAFAVGVVSGAPGAGSCVVWEID
jgi:phosphodiesterase/alkaline phosphatase D-like protein